MEEIKDQTLATHIKNNKVAPSYLLIDRDTLKLRAIARWFSGNFNTADIFHLEGTPNIKVEETMNFVSKAHLASVGDKKLFIICDTSTMTPAAQNKILKTIEDTPTDTIFLLLASSATPILNTIKSRCVIIYPNPIEPSLTENSLLENHPNAKAIFTAVEKLLTQTKTLDDALPHLPLITKKENLPITFIAINHHATKLTIPKRTAILKSLAIINRNIAAGCNPQNAFDILLMELYK